MAMIKDEGGVKKVVKKILKIYEPTLHYDMPPANMFGIAGRHDFVICQKGRFWTIETKYANGKPNDNQISYAEKVRKAGGISVCINENNLDLVSAIASYVDDHGVLPYSLNHDFTQWRKNANKK